MQALIQRVSQAKVEIEGKLIGQINKGLLVLLGIEADDNEKTIDKMVSKLTQYRVFQDKNDHMNLSVMDVKGSLLVVSQFTLAADTKKGLRPSFSRACAPDKAKELYDQLIVKISQIIPTQTGQFAADMQVTLTNDGPVTFLLSA